MSGADNELGPGGKRGKIIQLADYLRRRPPPDDGDAPPRSPIAARRPVEPIRIEAVGLYAPRAASVSGRAAAPCAA